MFFIKDLKTGDIKGINTANRASLFLLGRIEGQHEVYYSPAAVALPTGEGFNHYGILRALEQVEQSSEEPTT